MAFPFVYEANFETADASEWDSETDTGAQLDFPRYFDLARFPWPTAAPHTGSACMRATLSGGTDDAFVTEGDIDIAADTTRFAKFDIWFSPNFTATADDTINVFELQSTGPVVEATFGFRVVASTGVINFGIGETAPTSFGSVQIERGRWYTVELQVHLDAGGGNDGTIDLFVTKEGDTASTTVHATQVGSLDQAAVIQGVLGVQDHLATTTGTILFDGFRFDDERVFPERRFKRDPFLTKSGHAFIGPGSIDGAALLTTGGSNVMKLYDTDVANTDGDQEMKVELDQDRQTSFTGPLLFEKGCFVELSGTNPRGKVIFQGNTMEHAHVAPRHHSTALVRRWGQQRF